MLPKIIIIFFSIRVASDHTMLFRVFLCIDNEYVTFTLLLSHAHLEIGGVARHDLHSHSVCGVYYTTNNYFIGPVFEIRIVLFVGSVKSTFPLHFGSETSKT